MFTLLSIATFRLTLYLLSVLDFSYICTLMFLASNQRKLSDLISNPHLKFLPTSSTWIPVLMLI